MGSDAALCAISGSCSCRSLEHSLATCSCLLVAACRRMDCLALSYLEVLQAAPMEQLSVPAMAAEAGGRSAALSRFLQLEPEPQCSRLAHLFAVPALQPLLAQGGVEALLAGAQRLLVSWQPACRWASLAPVRCDKQSLQYRHPHPVPALFCVQTADEERGLDPESAQHFAAGCAAESLLQACRACPAVVCAVTSDAALLRLLSACADNMLRLSTIMVAEVRRSGLSTLFVMA